MAEQKDPQIARLARRAAARERAPQRTYKTLVVAGAPDEWEADGNLYTIIARHERRRIDEDDPSVYGSHLLGREGEWGQVVTVELRPLNPEAKKGGAA